MGEAYLDKQLQADREGQIAAELLEAEIWNLARLQIGGLSKEVREPYTNLIHNGQDNCPIDLVFVPHTEGSKVLLI